MKRPVSSAVAIAALALGLAGCGGQATEDGAGAGEEAALEAQQSDGGLFTARITPLIEPVEINKLQTWALHLESADGKPVPNAAIEFDVVWPHTGLKMQTQPSITDQGQGDYLVEGIKLHMTGPWEVYFSISASGKSDEVAYVLDVKDSPGAQPRATAIQQTERGLFHVTIEPSRNPIPVDKLHTWTLLVKTPDGEPVTGATITVDGDMPAHGHGLPTRPQVSEAGHGPGGYQIDGMKFQMPGEWELYITISADGKNDNLTYPFVIE